MSKGYTDKHAIAGLSVKLPKLDTFPNQFQGYEITISYPEFTSICPKTGLPDFGTVHVKYMPNKKCLELKSIKLYMVAYRNVGIFYENVVNRILKDCTTVCDPHWMAVKGIFNARGGMTGIAEAKYGDVPSTLSFPS